MNRSFRKFRVTIVFGAILCLIGVALTLSTFIAGSRQNNSKPAKIDSNDAGAPNASNVANWLNSALDMLQPERLGISSEVNTAVALLNDWDSASSTDEIVHNDQLIVEKLLSAAQMKRVSFDRFVARDGRHIRNCLWYRMVVDFVVGSADNDLDRAVDLFYYCVRSIDLIKSEDNRIPLSLFTISMLGKGTAEDRAWLFSNLLRQLQIDSVILRPAENSGIGVTRQPSANWLVGVLLDDHVYLFDMRIGLPIPTDWDQPNTPLVRRPATLAEVRANDQLLRQLDLNSGQSYPLHSEALNNVKVELVGNTSLWASRMQRLQTSLSGARSAIIHDGLGCSQFGLFARIASFGSDKWKKDDIEVWPYPEERIEGRENLDKLKQQQLILRQRSFDVPVPITGIDQGTETLLFGTEQRLHRKARTLQLVGNFSAAIRGYLSIRLWERLPPMPPDIPVPQEVIHVIGQKVPPWIQQMHRSAAEEAFVWMGCCQFEKGDFVAAASTFRNFLQRYDTRPWVSMVRYLYAICLVETDKLSAAIEALEEFANNEVQHDGYELLIRRWKQLQKTQ